jgi:signal transduction histidine kinase
MHRANEGDLSVRVATHNADEIGYATQTFNVMLASIQRSDKELRQMATRLRDAERLELIGTLVSVIAHQLKNPLLIIQGAIGSLKRRSTELDQEFHKFLTILQQESSRTSTILERFLDFAKKQEVFKQPIDASEFLETTLLSFKEQLCGIELTVEAYSGEVIAIDRALVTEVLLNVLENAKEALLEDRTENPSIKVLLKDIESEVCFEVVDNGPGLSDEALDKAFTPFFTTKTRGTGLGLSMANKVLLLHGGSLSISRCEGDQGTRVSIHIPRLHENKEIGGSP